jgi:5-methylthioadenosine/S-adenosylhomocysteine deaminase
MALVLIGTVVTFDRDRPVLDPGAVYVGDDGHLEAVRSVSQSAPAGFSNAERVETEDVIYPGLIDLHSHLAYNTLPLWKAAHVPYNHHDAWPDEDEPPDYSSSITWPQKVLGQAAAEALIKYVEVKALVGGTTSIQGAPHTTRPVTDWLIRIVDIERLPNDKDLVMCAALQRDIDSLRTTVKENLEDGQVMIYHVAEGLPAPTSNVIKEFTELESTGCLQPGLIGVHATALGAEDFALWRDRVKEIDDRQRGTLVWSPFSNLWLYHRTTDVVEADKKGFRIALGSDWSPSGTKHVLGELKVADSLNQTSFDSRFSDLELCEMVTANPGDALSVAWGPLVGRLKQGALADLIICERRNADPYRNLIEATERHIRLVMVRGQAFYGMRSLMTAAGVGEADTITVAGQHRALLVKRPDFPDATLDWPGVKAALEAVRDDPVGKWQESQDALAAWGGSLDEPDAPLVLFGDMPEGDLGLMAGSGEIPADITIPGLNSLSHDAAFFAAVKSAGPAELQTLADYYS